MNTLTDLYNQAIVPMDAELEKQAAELVKQAEEEDAAGRIMARGFADELHKLAEGPGLTRRPNFSVGGRGAATETAKPASGSPAFGRGSKVTPGGNITPPKPKAPPAPTPGAGAKPAIAGPSTGKGMPMGKPPGA